MNNGDFNKNNDSWRKESFLAPTPSYKQSTPGFFPMKTDMKEPNNSFIKGTNSSQYMDLLPHNSSAIFNGPSFFATSTSPAYQNGISAMNYYNKPTPNVEVQQQIEKKNELDDNNTIYNNKDALSLNNPPSSYGIVSEISEDIKPILQNIVSTANLKCSLDLRTIALHAKNAEYNPKRFAAVIMRIKEPKTTALIFASGKMVCTGARSEEDSRKAARQYAKIIQKLGYKVVFSEFKIQNIVGSCDVKFQISLEGLSTSNKYCSYEPEIFPGLIFKMYKPKIVLLIFVSGKIVLTGAKERKEIFEAFQVIYPLLYKFKKISPNAKSTENESLNKIDEP